MARPRAARQVGHRSSDLVDVLLRWTFVRAFLHRGWWLVTSLYLIIDAGLGPAQLVAITVGQGAIALVCEIPAGVVADTISRRWSLVLSHVLMGAAMAATGLVTDFAAILATQMLWGLSWTFASGADIAWITDELDAPARMNAVLLRQGRAQLLGSAAGIVALGTVASVGSRGTTMVAAGVAMVGLGAYVHTRFREVRFVRTSSRRWARSWSILSSAMHLARTSRLLLLVFAVTMLVNGAHEFARLYPLRLVESGFPAEPLVWFSALSVLMLLLGAAVLRLMETRLGDSGGGRAIYALGCGSGAVGLVAFALAPDPVSATVAVVAVAATAEPITRTISAIWVNQNVGADQRATMHSFLAQSEYLGEIGCGAAIVGVAASGGMTPALLLCAGLFALALGVTRWLP